MGKAKLKLGDAKIAVTYFQRAAELNPDEDSLFYLLSKGLRALGREEEAKKALQRVSELHATTLDAQKRALQDAHVVATR
jgi:Flp pilus assembly protein TadD